MNLYHRLAALVALVFLRGQAPAQVLFSDGFEDYTAGGNPLDENTTDPNWVPNFPSP